MYFEINCSGKFLYIFLCIKKRVSVKGCCVPTWFAINNKKHKIELKLCNLRLSH